MSKVFSEGNYKIFSEGKQQSYLKVYLETQIEECDSQIGECKRILTSDSDDILPEDRIQSHRKLEVIQYRRFWLYEQIQSLDTPWLRKERITEIVNQNLQNN